MPKQSLVINGFQGGINKDSDPTDIASGANDGRNELAKCFNMLADMPGRLRGKFVIPASGGSDITAGVAVDATTDNLLLHGTKYYRNRGVYKVGGEVEWSQKNLVRRPTKSTLGTFDATSASMADGIAMNVDAASIDATNIWLGEDASVNGAGLAMLGDTSVFGTELYGLDVDDGITPRYIAWDREDTSGTSGTTAASFFNSGSNIGASNGQFKWAMVDKNNSYNSTPNIANGNHDADVDIGSTATQLRLSTVSATTGITTDDRDMLLHFRLGNMEYTANTDEPVGLYGNGVDIQGKDINLDMHVHTSSSSLNSHDTWVTSFEKIMVVANSNKDSMNLDFDTNVRGKTIRIWEMTRSELTAAGAFGGRNRFSIPASSYVHDGATFDITNVKTISLIVSLSAQADLTNDSPLVDLWELSLTGAGGIGWYKQKPFFYQTKLYQGVGLGDASYVESLPSSMGQVNFENSKAAKFKIFKPTTSNYKGKMYYQLTDATGAKEDDKFLLADIDENKGVRKVGTDDWTPWNTVAGKIYVELAFDSTPMSKTFLFESGYKNRTETINANWKTATTAGRQAYIGNLVALGDDITMVAHAVNAGTDRRTYPLIDTIGYTLVEDRTIWLFYVSQTLYKASLDGTNWTGDVTMAYPATRDTWLALSGTISGGGDYNGDDVSTLGLKILFGPSDPTNNDEWTYEIKYDGDRILKAPPGNRYGFSDKAFIDLELGGTNITHLDSLSDRLFAFSDSKLTIVNIAQDFEYLEATYDGYGVSGSRNVCKLREGLAWVNATGVYYFDGGAVNSLTDDRLLSATFTPTSIAYYGSEKLLLVWYNGDNLLTYSFKSKSWVCESLAATVDNPSTNSVYYNNIPYWFDTTGGTHLLKKASLGSASNAVDIQTGDVICGDLSRRKGFLSLHVTVKNGTELLMQYDIDASGSWSSAVDFPVDTGINTFKIGKTGKKIRFRFTVASAADTAMEISDITLVYRNKNIK